MTCNGKKYPSTMDYTPSRKRDIFARDPFKVQSYKFRYAEPPGFNLKIPYNTCPKSETQKGNFYESRRRKFIQSNNAASNMFSDPAKANITQNQKKVFPEYARPYYKPAPSKNCQPQSQHAVDNSERMKFYCGGLSGGPTTNSRFQVSKHTSAAAVQNSSRTNVTPLLNPLKPKKSTSLCQINIKIQRSDDNLLQERLIINIATNESNSLYTGNSPYSSDCLAVKGESSPNFLRAHEYREAQKSRQTNLEDSLTDNIFSSDSASDIDTQCISDKKPFPHWVSTLKMNDKSNTPLEVPSRSKKSICNLQRGPFGSSPYLGIQRKESFKQVQKKNSTLVEKRSTQTIVNNLNTDDTAKCRTMYTRSASKTFVNLTDAQSRNIKDQPIQDRRGIGNSITNFVKREDITKVKNMGNNVTSESARVSTINLRRSASTVSKSESSPLHVNINLYNQPRLL